MCWMKQHDSVGRAQALGIRYTSLWILTQVSSLNKIFNCKLLNGIANQSHHANMHACIEVKFMERILEYIKYLRKYWSVKIQEVRQMELMNLYLSTWHWANLDFTSFFSVSQIVEQEDIFDSTYMCTYLFMHS